MKDFSGVYTALITPFKQGEIDWASLKKLVRAQLDGGIQGFVINGTTGESPTITSVERPKIFEFIKTEVAGQIPLIMGTGSNSTVDTVENTRAAEKLGADAALVVVPYYNRPPQRGLYEHFKRVAASTSLPILLYNVPSRTVAKLEWDTVVELSHLSNVIGIKEATGDIPFGKRLVDGTDPGFLVTSGDDSTYLELIAVGGKGVISVASHILPKQFTDWSNRMRKKDESARKEMSRFADLIGYMGIEANPIPVKMALHLMGIIESPELRLPLATLAKPFAEELRKKLQSAGLL